MAACPTRVSQVMCQSCLNPMHCTGTGVAPSHRPQPPIDSKLQNLLEGGTAWDKRERVGEASHPGPEPPRELYLDRKNGQRDPIRLCKQNGGWVWNVHSVPPLRVRAKRSTPQDALRNWLNKHENAITPASVEAARQLAKEWENYPMPLTHQANSQHASPGESGYDAGAPRHGEPALPGRHPASQSQNDPPPRRRLRGKTPAQSSPGSPPRFCPADSSHGIESQHSEGMAEPYGCWDEIYDVLRKPVLVDRNIPRELKTLWQRTVLQLLCAEQSRTDVYPIASDLIFILPKLILSHPPGKEKAKDRLHRIQECLRRASQGEWPYLIARTLELSTPSLEPDERQQPLATGPDSLPPRTAKRLYKAASQGQLGKAWRQLRAPPPVHVGPKQWDEAVAKLTPHEHQEGSVPLREDIAPERWHPTPREYTSCHLQA